MLNKYIYIYIKKRILHSWRARAHTRCLPRCESLIKHFTDSTPLLSSSCLALWPASLTAEQACFYKAAVKRGESRYGWSWGLFRRSKILNRSIYSALWLGGLRCQCRRQTNGPLTARCPCVMVLGKKKNQKEIGPFSASAHRENARYARLPVQPCTWVNTEVLKCQAWMGQRVCV